MSEELVFYNIEKGDLSALAEYSADSAKVLHKYGAHRFDSVCREVIYFMEAVEYHAVMLKEWHEKVLEVDKEKSQRLEIQGGGWFAGTRDDVKATVFELDSILVCARSMFDRLVRVLETPVSQQLPQSINDFIKKRKDLLGQPLCKELIEAWKGWGQRIADYRDCLLHYWTLAKGQSDFLSLTKERELLLPDEPTIRSIANFSYEKKIRIVDYSSEIKQKTKLLVESIFRQVFEFLVAEEFGDRVHYTYWEDVPLVSIKEIKGSYEIPLSPGIVEDAKGNVTRFKRNYILQNGKEKVTETLPSEWCERAEYPLSMESEVYSTVTEMTIALKKIADLERDSATSGK